jgi:hypothetical protein
MQSETIETLESARTAWSRNNPYSATVLENRLLTGPDSEKETRHIEMDLADSGIEYLPGDSAGILPVNTCDGVDLVLDRLQFTGDEPVTDFYGKPLNLRQALTSWLMIGKLSGSTLKGWAKHTGNPELSDLALPANKEKLDAYLWGREFLDLVEHAPAKLDEPQQLFKLLPRLAPRLYSISSSQALLHNQIDLRPEPRGCLLFSHWRADSEGRRAADLHSLEPALSASFRSGGAGYYGRSGNRRCAFPGLSAAQAGGLRALAYVALLWRAARFAGLPLP